jgi:ABC-2 type transport system ATP-binding protein
MTDYSIEFQDVSKRFGAKRAVERLSLNVPPWNIVALVGHNGAGKSVAVKMLATLMWPTSGTVRVMGVSTADSPEDVRRRMGTCLDSPLLWLELSARETVALLADAYRVDPQLAAQRVGDALECLRGQWHDSVPISDYSFGMSRKLGLALSVLHAPPVLVWDEPEAGLDAPSRELFRDFAKQRRRQGNTILISTHAVELVEDLADTVAVIRRGALVRHLPASELQSSGESVRQQFMKLVTDAGD